MLLTILHVLLIPMILYVLRPQDSMQLYYWAGALFKILCGLVLGVVYIHYLSGGDTLFFHQKAMELYDMPLKEYLPELITRHYPAFQAEARTELFSKILSIFYWIDGGSYWITSAYISLIAFFSSWYLIRVICRYFPHLRLPALVAFLLVPSAVFWTSGILKDSLISASVYVIFSIAIHYQKGAMKYRYALPLIPALMILFYLKFYLFAILMVLLFLLAVLSALQEIKPTWARVALVTILLMAAGLLASRANRNLNLDVLPQAVVDNYTTMNALSANDAHIHFPKLSPTYFSLITHAPLSLVYGLSRPWIWEANIPFLLSSIENVLLILLMVISLKHLRSVRPDTLGYCAIAFVLVLFTMLPLVSPNFGTLIRYRAVVLPTAIFLASIIPYQRLLAKK